MKGEDIMVKLPNLELLYYQAKLRFFEDEERKALYKELVKIPSEELFYVDVFRQVWGNTATAFDMTDDGEPTLSGCAMTTAYTVVFFEPITETYLVFIDNKLCYQVTNANKVFLDDLKRHSLRSLYEATRLY